MGYRRHDWGRGSNPSPLQPPPAQTFSAAFGTAEIDNQMLQAFVRQACRFVAVATGRRPSDWRFFSEARLRPRLTQRAVRTGQTAARRCWARTTASRAALRAPASACFGPCPPRPHPAFAVMLFHGECVSRQASVMSSGCAATFLTGGNCDFSNGDRQSVGGAVLYRENIFRAIAFAARNRQMLVRFPA